MTNAKFTPTICLDWDGVIHSYTSGWVSVGVIPDAPVPGAMDFIFSVIQSGQFKLAIHSSRSSDVIGLGAMQEYLIEHMKAYLEDRFTGGRADTAARELVFTRIEWPTSKPAAWLTLDDRAWTFMGRWPLLEEIAAFKPWNKVSDADRGLAVMQRAEQLGNAEVADDVIEDVTEGEEPWTLGRVLEEGFKAAGWRFPGNARDIALLRLAELDEGVTGPAPALPQEPEKAFSLYDAMTHDQVVASGIRRTVGKPRSPADGQDRNAALFDALPQLPVQGTSTLEAVLKAGLRSLALDTSDISLDLLYTHLVILTEKLPKDV
jgi:hypothetical protein